MPQTAQKFQMTTTHYQGLFAPPVVLPSRQEIFDFQVETLVAKKFATYTVADPFRNRLAELPNDRILLVPEPPKELDLTELMSRVELNNKTGVNYIDRRYLKDEGEYPTTASLLADVEDGAARLNVKPMASHENIAREKRHPYNTWRGIIHVAVFPWVLKHHYLDLVGTRCDGGRVPRLCVNDDEPALSRSWEDFALPYYGAPSAGSVIVP
jgi:hypothetical protein